MNENLSCPLCHSINLNEFRTYTSNPNQSLIEENKIQCLECKCEAPLENWNNSNIRNKCPH